MITSSDLAGVYDRIGHLLGLRDHERPVSASDIHGQYDRFYVGSGEHGGAPYVLGAGDITQWAYALPGQLEGLA